jgi:accessory gene regulator B
MFCAIILPRCKANGKMRILIMINRFAESVANYFVENKIVPAGDKSIYKYGTEVAISSVLGLLAIILISVFAERLQDGVLFLLCFISIRIYAGGYHANTYLKCNITFISVYLLILGVSGRFPKPLEVHISVGLMILSIITIIFLSPTPNKHKPLNSKEKIKYRQISILLSFLWIAFSIILFMLNIMNIMPLISITMFIIAALMVVEKIISKKKMED